MTDPTPPASRPVEAVTVWIPNKSLVSLRQEGSHVAVQTAIHRRQVKSGNATAFVPDSVVSTLQARAEAAEREHQEFRLQNDREWKAKVDHQKARARQLEEALRTEREHFIRNLGYHERSTTVARIDAALYDSPAPAQDGFDAAANLEKTLNQCDLPSEEELEAAKQALARMASAPAQAPAVTEDTGDLLKRVIDQVRVDFASAHKVICELQGGDPEKLSWPEWSSIANTLRWFDQIEAALSRRDVVEGWRPIETAPKDGTDVLVSRTDEGGGEWFAVAQWWVRAWAFMSGRPGDLPALLAFEPTHWMPLPVPPSPEECATDGCSKPATVHFERGGVGSRYCEACYLKIQALPASPSPDAGRDA